MLEYYDPFRAISASRLLCIWWFGLVALKRAVGMIVRGCSSLGLGLLGEEDGLDVGEDAALSDGDAVEEFVELLVVADGEL